MLPYLENYENHKHLSFNCLLCGKCQRICPVNLPVPDLIVENRKFFFENKILDFEDNLLLHGLRKFFLNRNKMNRRTWVKKYSLRRRLSKSTRKLVQIPKFSKHSFNQIQQEKTKHQ